MNPAEQLAKALTPEYVEKLSLNDRVRLDMLLEGDGECRHCSTLGVYSKGTLRRQNTAYIDVMSNFVILCDRCDEDNETYWSEMWAEYYAGVL